MGALRRTSDAVGQRMSLGGGQKPDSMRRSSFRLAQVGPGGVAFSTPSGIPEQSSETPKRQSWVPRRSSLASTKRSSLERRSSVFGHRSTAHGIDILFEQSVACRELWLRFLSRSGSGHEGWLAHVHAESLKVNSCSSGSRRALLERLLQRIPSAYAQPASPLEETLTEGQVSSSVSGAGVTHAHRPRIRHLFGCVCSSVEGADAQCIGLTAEVKTLVERSLALLATDDEAGALGVLAEANCISVKYLEARILPFRRIESV